MTAKTPKPRGASVADLILPGLGTLYALYYVASVWGFPPEAQRSGLFLAGLFLTLSALLVARSALKAVREGWRPDFEALLGPEENRRGRLAFLLLIFGYLAVAPFGGFTLTTFAFLLLGGLAVGLRPFRRALAFAAIGALGGWAFFIALLGTRFPQGPFERLTEQLAATWN
ncbi:tripartite tricarboxylate transporter TctB family protein [Rubrimonas cliftonensis]|uniref:DUF1468 domain-containing protein n=1 Tax=Rubrimonas cliftonensis TaxID=89524 RepID=A0A1H4CNF0_9RHOB|nr:tripartite tricarboxylate transporter TctB family protein [Rubrimonas cliftonensis]SEA61849.1 hypothetical protein SAMN05444370_107160 [Rubrimonas cliftonensis]